MKSIIYSSRTYFKILTTLLFIIFTAEISGQANLELIGRWAYGEQHEMYFHPEDSTTGYISSGANLIIVDFSDPLNPVEINKVTVEKIIDHFILVDDYLYVGDRYNLRIYNITDPVIAELIQNIPLDDQVSRLFYDNNKLYQAGGGNLTIFDIEERISPQLLGVIEMEINLPDLAFNGEYVYGSTGKSSDSTIIIFNTTDLESIAINRVHFSSDFLNTVEIVSPYLYVGGRDSLYILNIENAASPQLVKTIFTDWLYDIEIEGDLAFFSAQGHRMKIYDISDHFNPLFISNISGSAEKIKTALPYLYSLTGGPIQVHDVSDIQNPEARIALISFGASYNDIEIKDQYALLASYSLVLTLDLQDPTLPAKFSTVDEPATNVEISGNYCYFANRWNGWSIADISDVSDPRIMSDIDTDDRVEQIKVQDNYAYLADWGGGIRIYDVSDPMNPVQTGSYITDRDFQDLTIVNSFVYAFERQYGLKVIDVSDKTHPVAVDSIPYPGYIEDMIQYKNYLFIATGGGRVLDITDPGHPNDLGIQFSWWTDPAFDLINDTLYVTDRNQGLMVYKLTDLLEPELIAQYAQIYRATDVKVIGDLIYLLDEDAGLYVLQLEESSTSVIQVDQKQIQLDIYPIPSNQFINLEISTLLGRGSKLVLQNQLGIIVWEEKISSKYRTHQVDMSHLPSGSYFITLINGGVKKTEKIVLVK